MQTLKLSANDIATIKNICDPANWRYEENKGYSYHFFDLVAAESVFLRNALSCICSLSPTNSETHIIDGRFEILRTQTNPFYFPRTGVATLYDVKYIVNLDEIFGKSSLKSQTMTMFAKNPEQLEVAKKSNTPDEAKKLLCNIF